MAFAATSEPSTAVTAALISAGAGASYAVDATFSTALSTAFATPTLTTASPTRRVRCARRLGHLCDRRHLCNAHNAHNRDPTSSAVAPTNIASTTV